MSSYNRLAIYGHRGWASSAIVEALVKSGAPLKVLYRPGSDVSTLPASISTFSVDTEDSLAVAAALQDVDILISLVGHEGVKRQYGLIKAIPKSQVKLFVPSDLGFLSEEPGPKVPIIKAKMDVEDAAKNAGIPMTVILAGCLAESSLSTSMLGVNCRANSIVHTGDSKTSILNICTRQYVAAAYASLFAHTALSQLQNRTIGLSEIQATGSQIAEALKKKHGETPQILMQSLESVDQQIDHCVQNGIPLALAWYCRRVWGARGFTRVIGTDILDVPGYTKATLEELIVEGKMQPYRSLPQSVIDIFDAMSEKATPV